MEILDCFPFSDKSEHKFLFVLRYSIGLFFLVELYAWKKREKINGRG